jgi:prophage DNA circulation protein
MANLPGKFRNAAFLTDTHDMAGGRRIALHEYPLRDVPYAEDMGRKARTWSIEAFTLADDSTARDALIDALEEAGPGTLSHPYLGTLRAVVQDFSVSESTHATRVARFSITFAEAGERLVPAATQDTASSLDAAASIAKTASEASFASRFGVAGLPSHVNDRAFADIGALLETASDWGRTVLMPIAEASAFARTLSGFASALTVLLGTPASLAAQIGGIFTQLRGAAGTAMSAVRGLAGARDYQRAAVSSVPSTPAATAAAPARAQVVANTRAVHELVRRSALIESARSTASLRFGSGDAPAARADAQALRDALADQIDIEADSADDTTYQALMALRTALVRHVTARAVALPNAATVSLKATLPALVIAHQIHGDATRAGELVDRNHIRHPGFVTGGTRLEVLHG